MKLYLLALALLFAGQNPTEGTIEGRVLRAGSGAPIPNMPVTLISSPGLSEAALTSLLDQISGLVTIGLQGGGGGGSQDLTIQQVTRTLQAAGPGVGVQASVLADREGHYVFTGVPRGRYTVWVQRFNYFGPLVNGVLASTVSATITLDPARPLPPVDLVMTQGSAISGRILDERGRPANGMAIVAYRQTFIDGKPAWAQVLSRPTDDRGEYRLSPLSPGDYYVGVIPPQIVPTTTGPPLSVRTFYPGVTEPAQATKLTLKGSDTTGVDFTLRSAPSTFFKISGFALSPTPIRAPDGTVDSGFPGFVLIPRESNVVDNFSPQAYANVLPPANRASGEFEIRNVRPGVYDLYPQYSYSGYLSGRTAVDIRSTDAPGVRVAVAPLVSIPGRVVVPQANPRVPVNLGSVRVSLKLLNTPPARGSIPGAATVNATGEFSVLAPGATTAMLQVTGLPEAAFVSDIRMGNNSVFDTGFEITSPPTALQAIIDTTTSGAVDVNAAQRSTVVLVPAEDRRQNPMRYKIGTTDDAGRLTLRGVPPGSYTAFAWESVIETAWQNPEFLSKYRDMGTSVTVAPGAQLNLQLKRIPFDADLR
jgi:hypothetical protein